MPTLQRDGRTLRLEGGHELPLDSLGRCRFRANLAGPPETRADGDDKDPIGFKGHAAVFNKRAWIGSKRYGFWEEIAPGAFTKTISEADVRFLINHDPNLLLARNREAETLRLSEDEVGLAVDADMAPTSYAKDLAISLERRDITQMSFAFDIISYRFEETDDGAYLYVLTELRLWDVAVVTYPAYEDTDAGLRGAAFDALMRSAGLDDQAAEKLLRRLTVDGGVDLSPIQRVIGTGPAETTRDGDPTANPAPAPTTRDTTSQPAETTGDPIPGDRLRDLRHAELARTLTR